MGWDAFGLPAENAAITNKLHPETWTYSNIDVMRKQLKAIGLSYDWKRELTTCDPSYYKHEQKFFIDLLNKGLAYQKESIVNWDPVDQTVLANEQVENGRGWRSGALVEKKYLKQWFLRITNYNEELLKDIDSLDGWPDKVKTMQKNWIDKSQGANFYFNVVDSDQKIEVYTTTPEAIFGATFVALAYNHPFIENIKQTDEIKQFIGKCIHNSTAESEIEKAEKEAVFTGLFAAHPFDKDIKLPIIIANFVLMDYGSGAIYWCPAHDQRDFELSQNTKNLPESVVSQSRLNIDWSFETFVPGKANQLARAAALQVADNPGRGYNPLFIYGGVGLGKSHLIHAVGNALTQRNPNARARYIHAEAYVSDVVKAYQRKSFDEFKRYYHSLDLLLIDDIQFFAGKQRTQEEFFYAFEALIAAQKQIIITSDTYPTELGEINPRLLTRFSSGLTVAIEPPELEMRVAILMKKADIESFALPEEEAFFIAKQLRSNVRVLEGALKKNNCLLRFS